MRLSRCRGHAQAIVRPLLFGIRLFAVLLGTGAVVSAAVLWPPAAVAQNAAEGDGTQQTDQSDPDGQDGQDTTGGEQAEEGEETPGGDGDAAAGQDAREQEQQQAPQQRGPNVVVSIKPLHAIVAHVMRGVREPVLLLPGAVNSSTELSDEQKTVVEGADIVVWIGPQLEPFLQRTMVASGRDIVSLRVIDAPGLRLMDRRSPESIAEARAEAIREQAEREGRPVEEVERERADERAPRRGNQVPDEDVMPSQPDPRIWLSPRNTLAVARAVAEALAEADPENATRYRRNALTLRIALETLDLEVNAIFTPIRDRSYATIGNALQYFERNYTLTPEMRAYLDPDKEYTNEELVAVRVSFNEERARCIFVHEAFDDELAQVVTRRANGQLVRIDTFGEEIEAGPDAYAQLIRGIATQMAECLEPGER